MSDISLADARALAKLSQTELDENAGVPRGTTHDLESGRNKRPSHEVVTKIVRALQRRGLVGLTSDQLFPVPDTHEANAR